MNTLKTIFEELSRLSRKDYFWYFLFPGVLLVILMIFYFSGNPSLVELVCPKENPEWGLIENIQLSFILGIVVVSVYASFKKPFLLPKIGFGLIALFAIFIFLEEIDYGKHWMQYMYGTKKSLIYDATGVTNFHNQGNNAKLFKRLVYGLMMIIFFIAPFFKKKIKNEYISYLIPESKIISTLILVVFADFVPRFLVHFNIFEDAGFGNNIGEFSEVIFYYIFLLYVIQLIWEKKWPGGKTQLNETTI